MSLLLSLLVMASSIIIYYSMLRCLCSVCLFAPWVPGPRSDTKITVPPPPGGEVGGLFGVSKGYSHRLATTPYWKRMAYSDYALRMEENATRYPLSHYRPGEYDIRYLPRPYRDHIRHRPLLEVGESRNIPTIQIPVIFLVDLFDEEENAWFGRKYETVYVNRSFMREELLPQRFAVYATEEAYRLLQLPRVIRHGIHDEIPKSSKDYKKLLEKQRWEEERWRYTTEFLFRKYSHGEPEEWIDVPESSSSGRELLFTPDVSASSSKDVLSRKGGASHPTAIKFRKARKIKLF